MAEPGLHPAAKLLDESLVVLAVESPLHFEALRIALAELSVRLVIGQCDACAVRLDGPAPWVTLLGEQDGATRVDVRVSNAGLCAIVEGDLTLAQAAEQGALHVRGSVDDVIRIARAVEVWVHGALRSPSFPELGERFRSIRIHGFDESVDAAPSRKDERTWADPAMSDARSS